MTLIDRYSDAVAGNRHIRQEPSMTPDAQVSAALICLSVGIRSTTQGSTNQRDAAWNPSPACLIASAVAISILNRERKVVEWNAAAQTTLERQGEAADTASELSAALRRLSRKCSGPFRAGLPFLGGDPQRRRQAGDTERERILSLLTERASWRCWTVRTGRGQILRHCKGCLA